MSDSLRGLQPWLRPYAHYVSDAFPRLFITSVRRSRTEQLRLWYNRGNNPYPVAPPGTSKHEYGLAWDMVGPQEDLEQAGQIWEAMGGRWGGRFGDPIHFEA